MKTTRRHEPRGFEEDLARERDEHRQVGVALEQAIARRSELADHAETYQANEQKIRGLQSELQRRELVIARRERDLEQHLKRTAEEEWAKSGRTLEKSYASRHDASKKVAGLLGRLVSALDELDKARAAAQELEHTYTALVPAHVDEWSYPDGRDEAEWPALGKRLELVKAGPLRPGAEAEKQAARRAADARRSEQTLIRQAVTDALVSGTFGRLERLGAELRERAVHVAERQAAELVAQSTGDRVREAIRRRLERIRQLAAEPSGQAAESAEPVAVE